MSAIGTILIFAGIIGIIIGTGIAGSIIPQSGVGTGSPPGNGALPKTVSIATPATAASPTNVYYLGAQTNGYPNLGVQAQIQVINTLVEGSGCLSFWIAESLANNEWGQVGYYLCGNQPPVAFYQVWNLNTNLVIAGGNTNSLSIGLHMFTMQLQSGTVWNFAVDGTSMGTFDMGTATTGGSLPVETLSEEFTTLNGQFAIPTVSVPIAMQVQGYAGGPWNNVLQGSVYNNGGNWGIAGYIQNPSFPPDSFQLGGSLSTASGNLWYTGIITGTSSSCINTPVFQCTSTSTTSSSTSTSSSSASTTTTTSTSTALMPAVVVFGFPSMFWLIGGAVSVVLGFALNFRKSR